MKKNILSSIKGVQLKKCTDCSVGNQPRFAFKSMPSLETEFLELVHSYVCKMLVRSVGGARYFFRMISPERIELIP